MFYLTKLIFCSQTHCLIIPSSKGSIECKQRESHTLSPFCDVSHHKPLTLLSSLSCTHSLLSTSSHSIPNVCVCMCDVKMIHCLSHSGELGGSWLWCLGVACSYKWSRQLSLPVFLSLCPLWLWKACCLQTILAFVCKYKYKYISYS